MFWVSGGYSGHPLLKGRVGKYLSGDEIKHEFSHTILHNQKIDVGQNRLKDQFNNLRVVNNENVAKKPEPAAPDKGVRAQSPRLSEAARQPQSVIARPDTPKAAPQSVGQIKPVISKAKIVAEAAPVPPQNRVGQAAPRPQFGGPVQSPVARQSAVSPKPQAVASREDNEARLQQAAAKQAYLQHVEKLKREKERELEAKRRREQEDADRRRRDREDDERRRIKAIQDKKARDDAARAREKEELERQKEEKKAMRELGREAMMQDIARRRKEKIKQVYKKADHGSNQNESGVRNSSFYSNKSDSESKRPPSRGLDSRRNSVEKINKTKPQDNRTPSKQSSPKKPVFSKYNSEKNIKPQISHQEVRQSNPQLRNISKLEKPPQPTPILPKAQPEKSQPVLKRMDTNGSKRSNGSSRRDEGSVISGLTNDRTQDRHLFEYTDATNHAVDYPELPAFHQPQNFGKTAYFMGENCTAALKDIKDDIFDINKASDEINNRLFGDDLVSIETPKKSPKVAATNLDFITVASF